MSNNGQQQNQAAITKPKARTIADTIMARKDSFAAVLPKHMTIDRFMKVAYAALTRTPKLKECTPESLLMALASCSELGLEPNSPLKHAWLIPYGKECQLVIGFQGLLALARRSGEIASIDVAVVHQRDVFEYERGDDARIVHKPFRAKYDDDGKVIGPAQPGPLVAAYAITKLKDGSVMREVMERHEIDRIRSLSKAGRSGPWQDHYDEMAKKTVFRRHSKWLPLSTEIQEKLQRALDVDEDRLPNAAGSAAIKPIDVDFSMSATESLASELEEKASEGESASAPSEASPETPPTEQAEAAKAAPAAKKGKAEQQKLAPATEEHDAEPPEPGSRG